MPPPRLDVAHLLFGDPRRLTQRLIMAMALDPPPGSPLASRRPGVLPRVLAAPVLVPGPGAVGEGGPGAAGEGGPGPGGAVPPLEESP